MCKKFGLETWRNTTFGISRRVYEDNINTDLKEGLLGVVDLVLLSHDRIQC